MSSNSNAINIPSTHTVTEEEKRDFISANLKCIEPKKSKSDPRRYRIFTLPNGLECILISDPDTEKAACSMDVHVGCFSDPPEVKGLAHFLEHMLFLGTKKYPNEAEYDQFIKDHGGGNNAATYSHHTNYAFDVDAIHLQQAMDRFAQFFICPLFTESATNRELNAVDSEHCANLQDDDCRIFQIDKLQCVSHHPWSKFDTGSIHTLKHQLAEKNIDLRQNLLSFHAKYYSSNIMKLAVIGKEDIDRLSEIVHNTFTQIKQLKDFKTPTFSDQVFDKSLFPKLFKIIPIKEKRDLQISWMLDPIYCQSATNPTSLLSYCIGHEGKGSILSFLKHKGLATGLCAGIGYNKPEFAVFECVIQLTIKGMKEYHEVMFVVYQYIERLKALTTEQWQLYFEERQKVDQMRFNFKGKEEPYDYVESLSLGLQKNSYKRSDFLHYIADISFEFDVDLIRKHVQSLNVRNSYNYLISKEFEQEAKETEPWYGTKYATCVMDKDLIEKCGNIEAMNSELHCPVPNKYIAEHFEIFDEEKQQQTLPIVIHSNEKCKIYFAKDHVFKKPKLCVSIKVQCPYLDQSVTSQNLTNLLFMIFEDELSIETYDFTEADLAFKVKYYGQNTIYFEFSGYNDKLHVLTATVLHKFAAFYFTKEKFEINKEKLRQNLLSKLKSDPYKQTGMMGGYLYYKKTHSIFELVENINNSTDITYNSVIEHYKKIINGKLFIEALVFGNCTSNHVHNTFIPLLNDYLLAKTTETYKQDELKAEAQSYGCVKFEQNKNYILRFKSMNEDDPNSAIGNDYFFVLDGENVSDFAALKLFAWIIDAPLYDQLRTKQQLGYIVWSFQSFNKGMMSFRTVIQSPTKDPVHLDAQINAFLEGFGQKLRSMDDKTFELNKESVVNDLMEKLKTIKQQHCRYWNEIWTQRLQFNRFENVAKAIRGLTKQNIIEFYEQYICNKSSVKCKVSTQCFAHANEHCKHFDDKVNPVDENQRENITVSMRDIDKIQSKLECHPFPYGD